jgi:hypothetical protein
VDLFALLRVGQKMFQAVFGVLYRTLQAQRQQRHEHVLRVQRAVGSRQAFDGRQARPVRLDCQQQAGAHRLAVQQHRAGPADTVLTADVRTGEMQLLTQKIRQELPR